MRKERFVDRLQARLGATEVGRVERVLATARALLAAGSFVAIYLDPTSPSRYAAVTYSLLFIYVLYSVAVLAMLRFGREPTRAVRLALHCLDFFWPAIISFFTEGSNTPFYVYYMFVLLAAAYRWGMPETLITSIAGVVVVTSQVVLFLFGPLAANRFLENEFELNRFIIRSLYLLLMGFLLGYLAEEEKRLRSESWITARMMSKAQAEIGLRAAMQGLLGEILELAGAQQALVVIEEASTGAVFLWDARPHSGNGSDTLSLRELDPSERDRYFFDAPGAAWSAVRREKESGAWEALALDAGGARLRRAPLALPEDFSAAHPAGRLLAVSFIFGEDWYGRMYLLNPAPGAVGEIPARFLQNLLRQVGPAIYNVYLLRRLRSKIGAMERARVARELHDGVIQPMIAMEMQMDALQLQSAGRPDRLAEGLGRIQQLLRQEVVNVRELMEHLKPPDLRSQQLLDFLTDVVEKFHRETGIAASFVSEPEEVELTPRVCREVARIVQEALVNVRKHSGAHKVLVRFFPRDSRWVLAVDDDGRGFGFSGRLTQADLDDARQGPVIIKERVRSIGGELVVESRPGLGSRLEISLPRRGVRASKLS